MPDDYAAFGPPRRRPWPTRDETRTEDRPPWALVKNQDYHIISPFDLAPDRASGRRGPFAMLFGAVNWMHSSGLVVVPHGLRRGGLRHVRLVGRRWWPKSPRAITRVRWCDRGCATGSSCSSVRGDVLRRLVSGPSFKHALYPMGYLCRLRYVRPALYAVDPFHLPLINTLVLLVSGSAGPHLGAPCAGAWRPAQGCGLRPDHRRGLGLIFTGLQAFEYWEQIAHYGLALAAATSSTPPSSWPPAFTACMW